MTTITNKTELFTELQKLGYLVRWHLFVVDSRMRDTSNWDSSLFFQMPFQESDADLGEIPGMEQLDKIVGIELVGVQLPNFNNVKLDTSVNGYREPMLVLRIPEHEAVTKGVRERQAFALLQIPDFRDPSSPWWTLTEQHIHGGVKYYLKENPSLKRSVTINVSSYGFDDIDLSGYEGNEIAELYPGATTTDVVTVPDHHLTVGLIVSLRLFTNSTIESEAFDKWVEVVGITSSTRFTVALPSEDTGTYLSTTSFIGNVMRQDLQSLWFFRAYEAYNG